MEMKNDERLGWSSGERIYGLGKYCKIVKNVYSGAILKQQLPMGK